MKFYHATGTTAITAANNCGISDSDIGLALNHVGMDAGLKVAQSHISRDWSKPDKFNRQVLDVVKNQTK